MKNSFIALIITLVIIALVTVIETIMKFEVEKGIIGVILYYSVLTNIKDSSTRDQFKH